MSKDKELKGVWKELMEAANKTYANIEEKLIMETKEDLKRVIDTITTANDFRDFLQRCVQILLNDYQTLITLIEKEEKKNEN